MMAKLRAYLVPLALLLSVLLGLGMRLWRLSTLPPGLTPDEAKLGLAAQSHHLSLDVSPLLTLLESPFAHGADWHLRLVPALIGVLTVITVWGWLRSWYGQLIAAVAAAMVAVNPWAATLSREITPGVLAPLLLSGLLWVGTWAWRQGGWWRWTIAGMVVILALASGRAGWGALAVAVAMGVAVRPKQGHVRRGLLGLAAVIVIGAVVVAIQLWRAGTLTAGMRGASGWGGALLNNLLAFNIHGDNAYQANLGGEPLLNVFIGLMMVAGLLVAAARVHRALYRSLLVGFVVSLVVATLPASTAPSATDLAITLPVVLAMGGLGVSYMLDTWYTTFPFNAAARTTGQAAMALLLGLSVYQGYTQMFVAWANASETYTAYHEGAVGAGKWIQQHPFKGERYAVVGSDERPIVQYEARGVAVRLVTPKQVEALPLVSVPRQFVITVPERDQTVAVLKAKLAGGVLKPYPSAVTQADLYYVYEKQP